jgi:hypothetical protein
MKSEDTAPADQPDEPDDAEPGAAGGGADGWADDEAVPFGIDGLGIALDPQASCPHGFDRPYCPFGCA